MASRPTDDQELFRSTCRRVLPGRALLERVRELMRRLGLPREPGVLPFRGLRQDTRPA